MYQSVFQRYIFKQSTDRNKDIIITILKMIKTLGEEVKWLETEMDKQQEDQKSLKIENLEKMVANQKEQLTEYFQVCNYFLHAYISRQDLVLYTFVLRFLYFCV